MSVPTIALTPENTYNFMPMGKQAAIRALCGDSRLSRAALAIGNCLVEYTNQNNMLAWPSVAHMAKYAGTTLRTAQRAIKQLTELGYVILVNKGGSDSEDGRKTNTYGVTAARKPLWGDKPNTGVTVDTAKHTYTGVNPDVRPVTAMTPNKKYIKTDIKTEESPEEKNTGADFKKDFSVWWESGETAGEHGKCKTLTLARYERLRKEGWKSEDLLLARKIDAQRTRPTWPNVLLTPDRLESMRGQIERAKAKGIKPKAKATKIITLTTCPICGKTSKRNLEELKLYGGICAACREKMDNETNSQEEEKNAPITLSWTPKRG